MDNEWVAPQVGTLNLDHHETLDDQPSFPLFPACLELLNGVPTVTLALLANNYF